MSLPLVENIDLFLNDKPSVYALRQNALSALKKTGFPTKKTEAWKYTDVKSILNTPFSVNREEHHCHHDCDCHHHEESDSFIEIRFCDGKLHVEEYNLPAGITITPLPIALYENEYKAYILKSFDLEKHPFAALNAYYLEQGICITVESGKTITKPIHIKYKQNNCAEQQLNIHNILVLEKDAKLELLEEFIDTNNEQSYLLNVVNEIYLKANSSLNHYKIQKGNISANHLALNAVKQQKESSYKQFYLSDGAKLSRQETLIDLLQEKSSAEIYSAYRAKTNCLTNITCNINHLKEETFSNQYAKAVLEDNSSATFQGKIHIAPNAVKTSGHQLHKALYLNDNATLNCKPELEIYADDVKCSHGSSCGELDKDQLFYLTSRGIDSATAKELLINAHLEELLAFIPNPQIKDLFFF
jgi:Fe-S cluster assembly protein SufD